MADQGYIVLTAGSPRPRSTALNRRRWAAHRARHRYGCPGLRAATEFCPALRHDPELPPVPRQRPRHAESVSPGLRRTRSVVGLAVFGAMAISGWFAAAGATAFAQMVAP